MGAQSLAVYMMLGIMLMLAFQFLTVIGMVITSGGLYSVPPDNATALTLAAASVGDSQAGKGVILPPETASTPSPDGVVIDELQPYAPPTLSSHATAHTPTPVSTHST